MKLSKPAKWILGAATLWLLIYPIIFFLLWLSAPTGMYGLAFLKGIPEEFKPLIFAPILLIFPLHCLTIFGMWVLLAVYQIHVIKNSQANETIRIVLGVGLMLIPFVVMPIYYLIYVWPAVPPDWALAIPSGIKSEEGES